jgi:hypothetical protein
MISLTIISSTSKQSNEIIHLLLKKTLGDSGKHSEKHKVLSVGYRKRG